MNSEKLTPIIKGLIKHMPGVKKLLKKKGGNTIDSRYCYSVWMRHLSFWGKYNNNIPETVAELGPGESLGIGFAALLSGSEHLFSLDVRKYWNCEINLNIFNDLVELFKQRANIPDDMEYPKIKPFLNDYSFPSQIITDQILEKSLSEDRLNLIRNEIADIDNPENSYIRYFIPWNSSNIIKPESVDFIYSQAVLEHVEQLDSTYQAMDKWLVNNGYMSHTIDFKSHGVTKSWNGHWAFSDFEWKLVKGGKKYLINRQPLSKHIELLKKYKFKTHQIVTQKAENKLLSNQVSKRFRTLSPDDITTSGAYILAQKG